MRCEKGVLISEVRKCTSMLLEASATLLFISGGVIGDVYQWGRAIGDVTHVNVYTFSSIKMK